MSKKNFVSLIFGTVGGILFALVMVWNNLVWGIVVGLVGIVLLLCLIPLVKGIK